MNPLTVEWVDKAEGDFTTTLRELRARKSPNYTNYPDWGKTAPRWFEGFVGYPSVLFYRFSSLKFNRIIADCSQWVNSALVIAPDAT
jgi:hypothetical protein